MALKLNYRFPSPQPGQPAPAPPGQVQNATLIQPTDKTIPKLSEMNKAYPGMMEKIGHHYVQQVIANMSQQGLVFGPQGSQFSGTIDLV